MNILIVDDHPSFRRGVKEILTEELNPAKIGEAGDAQEMLDLVRRKKWDLVVMDISMPGQTGPEALKAVKEACPALPVLVLSMHPEDQYAIRMFKAGADGYLTKASAPCELVRAIKKVMAGGQYVSPTLGEKLAVTVKSGIEQAPHERLSDREYQVLCLIASGKTVSEIAEAVNLSVTTISTYRTRILEKMSMKNNSEITRYAMQEGLV
ncbi:MAG TPA: response regulator transcription factor [Nitrospiraceae bacterium]|nr:response regulator transcription factor [Nitrospiraceae bacterium]